MTRAKRTKSKRTGGASSPRRNKGAAKSQPRSIGAPEGERKENKAGRGRPKSSGVAVREVGGSRAAGLLSEPAQRDGYRLATERFESKENRTVDADGLARNLPNFPEEIAGVIGEQTATIIAAMDRWFEHILSQRATVDPLAAQRGPLSSDAEQKISSTDRFQSKSQATLRGRAIAHFNPAESWEGWRHHQSCAMKQGGHIEIRQQTSTPGIVTPAVRINGGCLVRLTVQVNSGLGAAGPLLHARLVDRAGSQISADAPIEESLATIFFYVPKRVKEIRLYLVAHRPTHGYSFSFGEVTFEHIEIEDYYAHFRGQTPVLASMATIPQRAGLLYDSVYSLLVRCDRVRVFLNGYAETPSFLIHPRIEIRRSQSWDDRGDAGKFAWVDVNKEAGYRIIADDDLIYPTNFVDVLVEASSIYKDKAIIGVHGILLKQPIKRYYDKNSRYAFYFQGELKNDRTVHILGTNAVCYHSTLVRMRWADFMWPNMADIFLARYAQRNGIPMLAVARPARWLQQNGRDEGVDTIFDHSERQTGSRFDTSWMQDVVISGFAPFTIQRTLRPKIAVLALLTTANELARFDFNARASFLPGFDWAILAVPTEDDPDLRRDLGAWNIDYETHVFANFSKSAGERFNEALNLARKIDIATLIVVHGEFRFDRAESLREVVTLISADRPLAVRLAGAEFASMPNTHIADRKGLVPTFALISSERCNSLRPLEAGGRELTLAMREWVANLGGGVDIRTPREASLVRAIETAIRIGRAGSQLAAPAKIEIVEANLSDAAPFALNDFSGLTPNEVFAQILVINLDRRSDRWTSMRERLKRAGIAAARVSAVDGTTPAVLQEYHRYLEGPSCKAPDARPVETTEKFFLDYDSQTARVAFAENKSRGKAISTAGAWGYLKTWQGILERALRERLPSILVFDDDVVLHKHTSTLFAAVVGGLPSDWLILQLGSLQYHWDLPWLEWHNSFLYSSAGAAIGSHAVGVRFEAMPYLLDQVNRMQLPFDLGALSATVRAFRERCFVAYPNIAIQSLYDSDINSSAFQQQNERKAAAATYRWRWEDYEFGANGHSNGASSNQQRKNAHRKTGVEPAATPQTLVPRHSPGERA
jgi:GR25 family glycosyltransferase involved in LPS biosynthesis